MVTSARQPAEVTNFNGDEDDKDQKQLHLSGELKTVAFLALMVGAGVFAVHELYENFVASPEKRIENSIQKGIRKSKCSGYTLYAPSVERRELNEHLRSCLHKLTSMPWWTEIIYGPCGSGKTAAVRNILKDQEAVIHVALGFGDDPRKEIVDSILWQVSPSSLSSPALNHDNKRRWALESALKSMQNKNPRIVPTLFIEVYGRSYGHDGVVEILNLLKRWVHKEGLVSAVVVLSPANEIGEALWRDVRATVVKIGHLTMDETKDYLLAICKRKELTGNQEEREQVAKELAPIIGNRLWDLQNLAHDVPKGGTLHDLKTLAYKIWSGNLSVHFGHALHLLCKTTNSRRCCKSCSQVMKVYTSLSFKTFTNARKRIMRSVVTKRAMMRQ